MYRARVYNVMIGAPSDITDEINVVQTIINEWNQLHSQKEKIMMLPLYWKHSSYPTAGTRPQESLDDQLVAKSDLLISLFGTRIGSPTGDELSGTIEEINLHIKTGKPVMVFFRNSADASKIDLDQFTKLMKYKSEIQSSVYWNDFWDNKDFGDLFRKRLQLFINDHWSKDAKDDDLHDEELIREAELYINLAIQKHQWAGSVIAIEMLFYALQCLLKCKDELRAKSSIDTSVQLIHEILVLKKGEGRCRIYENHRDSYVELLEKVNHEKKDDILKLIGSAQEVPEDFDEMGEMFNTSIKTAEDKVKT